MAYYPLDGNANDASGRGNHGIMHGGAWVDSEIIGGACDLDGVNDYIDCGRASSIDVTGDLTLAAWVKADAVGGIGSQGRLVIGKWYDISNTDLRQYSLGYALGGYPALHVAAGGTHDSIRATAAVAVGSWCHLAGVYDGTSITIYVNGIQKGSKATSQPITSQAVNVFMGNKTYGDYGSEYLDGQLDEVRVYHRALSASEIQLLYNHR